MRKQDGTRHERLDAQGRSKAKRDRSSNSSEMSEFIRPENEDDDGYDPYSDRPATREPLFEEDPWA